MTRRSDKDPRASRADATFEANMERHKARMEQAMAAHGRRIEAMKFRLAEFTRTREEVMKAIERRVAELMAARGRRRPAGRERRRDEEGGEPMPAVPRPKPKPLAGAAAAPIE